MTEHILFPITDLADESARKVEVDGHQIAIVRIGDELYAKFASLLRRDSWLGKYWVFEGFVKLSDLI